MNWAIRIRNEAGTSRRAVADGLLAALRQRAALVAEPRPEGVKGPPIRRLFGELRSLGQPLRWDAFVRSVPLSATPQVVMLLPGFGTHPVRMRRMARALANAGHAVTDWGLGFNLGPSEENFAALEGRALDLYREHGRPIVLVGWSLGGIFAREIAKRHPHAVAKVVTMGSPFSGNPRANNAWRIYHLITGHSVESPPVVADISRKPPVPTVALWSALDGIVSPRSSCGRRGERDRAVALRCGHLGFAASDEAIKAVLAELETA